MQVLLEDILDGLVAKSAPRASYSRDLGEADLALLAGLPAGALEQSPSLVARLRHSHHLLARLLAEGRKPAECAAITGYSSSRISILQRDPTFADLVTHYREQTEAAYVNVHERLAALGVDTLDELHARLDETPEKFSVDELQGLLKLTMDRAGFGPTSSIKHTHHVMTPEILARIKQEVSARQTGQIRQLDVSADRSPAMGGTLFPGTEVEEAEIVGEQGEGDGL